MKEIQEIHLDKLLLDKQNPRLPEGLKKSKNLQEIDIINWMLEDASIIELMLAIGENGFFIGEPLLIIKENSEKYIVVEGNRRLTSLKLLQNPTLANIHTKKIQKVLQETTKRETKIPCIIFNAREEIRQYVGYRHVTCIKSWGLTEKARYLNELLPTLESNNIIEQSRELAKKIGSRSDYVKKLLIGYQIYEIIKDRGFYKIPKLDETTFHFSYIAESIKYDNIKKFINIDFNSKYPLKDINYNNLEKLINLFFRKNDQNRSRVLGSSDNLTKFNRILDNIEVTNKFLDGLLSLEESYNLIEINSDTFHYELMQSLRNLKKANSYIHQIKNHNNSDIDTLKEIVDLCRVIKF